MKTKKKSNIKASKKQQKKKIIVASVAVGAAGILGYFGWQYLKKKKETKAASDMNSILKQINTPTIETPTTYNPSKPKLATKTKTTSTGIVGTKTIRILIQTRLLMLKSILTLPTLEEELM